MSAALPSTSREVRLVRTPTGLPLASDLEVVARPLPRPAAGEVLVRNRHFQVFAGLRTLLGGETDGLPLPTVRPGDTLFGPTLGEVVDAPEGSGLRPGDRVEHLLGWREYASLPVAQVTPATDRLPDPVARLSSGASAYAGLVRLARLREGDTVFVTGAAGGVGTLAGQLARLLGAGRVLGSTGSAAKAERLTALGYEAVYVRGRQPVDRWLREAAPEGIDVLLDTVGGEQLTAAVRAARPGARFALVGALAGQLAPERHGGSAPTEIDSFRVITRGISIQGLNGADHPGLGEEWLTRFADWLRADEITFPHHRIPGIERAPRALEDMLGGGHFGTVIVDVDADGARELGASQR
ncbi:NADP-dependent oxidoreductase [Streptomyces sp. NA04227]|uniref:MDR family NADP-dependent oxidoreductase n=1 Tax=Streptomyces sp. NA04227 TaxID=2742136 RepID=UPI0015922541|nr:NADP-dependent oxidoreductase [Streptomyces sp. NA04227]QKW05587.1 NADP-dependent oxidoreductase [Streptomyces sp. NA04227]